MQLAILGTGAVGPALGKAFSNAGHDVVIGTRDPVQTKQREQWTAIDLPLAAYQDLETEVFINATNGAGALSALQAVGDALTGKVVIDTSNALDFSQGFPPSLFVSNTDSLAEQLQRELPEIRLVKMFNTMANEVMVNPRGLSEDSTIFLAGNDPAARQSAASLAADLQSARPARLQHQGRPLREGVRDQDRVDAGSSVAGSSPVPGSYPSDCSSIGGLVLRMKNASTKAAMLISAATAKAV